MHREVRRGPAPVRTLALALRHEDRSARLKLVVSWEQTTTRCPAHRRSIEVDGTLFSARPDVGGRAHVKHSCILDENIGYLPGNCMQIILSSRRRSASGKRAIGRHEDEEA